MSTGFNLQACVFIKFCSREQEGYRLAYLSNFALKCNKAIGLRIYQILPKLQQSHRVAYLSNIALKCNKACIFIKFFHNMQQGCIFIKFCPKMQQGYYRLAYLSNFVLECSKAIGLHFIKYLSTFAQILP